MGKTVTSDSDEVEEAESVILIMVGRSTGDVRICGDEGMCKDYMFYYFFYCSSTS